MACKYEYDVKGCPYINDEQHKGKCSTSDCFNTCEQYVHIEQDDNTDAALEIFDTLRRHRISYVDFPKVFHQAERYAKARGTRYSK